MKMRAVVLEEFGGVDNLKMMEIPIADPKEGEVRIRISAASINPVDYKSRKGLLGGKPPMVLGVDSAGLVDAVGPGAKDLAVGDEVFSFVDAEGPASNGGYAEYVIVPAVFAARKPPNFSFPQAAAMAMVGLTAYQCVFDKARLEAGESIFVAGGSGAVGAVAIQLAKYCGAGPILTTAGSEPSFEYLTRELGIPRNCILDYRAFSPGEMKEAILERNGGRPVSAAFDFVGGEMKRLCFEVIDFDMRVVSIVEEPEEFQLPLLSGQKSPLFSRSGTFHFQLLLARSRFGGPAHWPIFGDRLTRLARLAEEGHVRPHRIDLLDDFSAESVRKAHSILERHEAVGKMVLPVTP